MKLYERTRDEDKENMSTFLSKTLIGKETSNEQANNERVETSGIPTTSKMSEGGIDATVPQDVNDFMCDNMDSFLVNAVSDIEQELCHTLIPKTFAPIFNNCSNITFNFSS